MPGNVKRRGFLKRKRVLSIFITATIVTSAFLIGVNLEMENASAAWANHTVGNLQIDALTDHGRIVYSPEWPANNEIGLEDGPTGSSFIGIVIDREGYDHTPGAEKVADCFTTGSPYANQDDFKRVQPIKMVVDDGVTQRSNAIFRNENGDAGDDLDLSINQTVWTVKNEDWAILQWRLDNIEGADLIDVSFGFEFAISQVGSPDLHNGLGGDRGDDFDGFDAATSTYWAQDVDGTSIGFASADTSDPIDHYYSQDFYNTYTDEEYKLLFANDTWLYNRLHAPSGAVGPTPGNRTSTVGWHNFDILSSTSRVLTLVLAAGSNYGNMMAAVADAQSYFKYVIAGFRITEFSDSGLLTPQTPQIEVYNRLGILTDMDTEHYFSLDGGLTPLTGTWTNNPIPPYDHGVFSLNPGQTVDPEGDTIGLYHITDGLVDEVAFGQDGPIPDPLDGESTARRYIGLMRDEYVNEWLRNSSAGPTFGSLNDVGPVIYSPDLVFNRVMFNPKLPNEGYIELMYTGTSALDLSKYRIVCDKAYVVPTGTSRSTTNRFFVLTRANYPANFGLDSGTPNGDNIYLYNTTGSLLDMVGWSSAHDQGYFMTRSPDGGGSHQGYDDVSSQTASWIFDITPSLLITEFDDATLNRVEVYNQRGGDKVLDGRWDLFADAGEIFGTWNPGTVVKGAYATFTRNGGVSLAAEGDHIRIYYTDIGSLMRDQVLYGQKGPAPDPLSGESTALYWNAATNGYSNNWNRETVPNFGTQNDVPGLDFTSFVILNEVMFYPSAVPNGRYLTIINKQVGWQVNLTNFMVVCDDVYTIPPVPWLQAFDQLIITWANAPALFGNMDSTGDNVYFYDPNGQLLDMVGWNTPHLQGMSVRRVPDGSGTYQGFDDASSTTAGWVFNQPLQVLMTEVSDGESGTAQIEVYNPAYPEVNFSIGAIYEFESWSSGSLAGTWTTPLANAGEYAVFRVDTPNGLDYEGDTISFYQNSILVEEISYGQRGTVPDPLAGESVQRIWDPAGAYTNDWGRQWLTGTNFGAQNDVPPVNFSSWVALNEVVFNPSVPANASVELYLRGLQSLDISGYKIVADTEYVIPPGSVLTIQYQYYYLTEPMDPASQAFFAALDPTGDNVYLYDANGGLVDMVGWSSPHNVDECMKRVPDGSGTSDGYDDPSSINAGWMFNQPPSYTFVLAESSQSKWGDASYHVWYSLNITNLQGAADFIDLSFVSENGWTVELYEDSGSGTPGVTQLADNDGDGMQDTGLLPPYSPYQIWVKVYVPFPPFEWGDNTTVNAYASLDVRGHDDAWLMTFVNPWVNPDAHIEPPAPTTIYEKKAGASGYVNETTVTLAATGMGFARFTGQDVMFILDSSGSMGGNDPDPDNTPCNQPFPQRVQASWNYVDSFMTWDRGGYVDFDSQARMRVPLTLNHTYLKMGNPLMGGQPGLWCSDQSGGTLFTEALRLANDELIGNGDPNHVWVMIFLTDGASNDPNDYMTGMTEAMRAASNGIIIFSIGLNVGNGSQGWIFLNGIADITGGQYFPAPTAGALADIFDAIMSLVRTIAGYSPVPGGGVPMVEFVLEDGIDYIDGTFQLMPGTIETDPNPDGIVSGPNSTTLLWNWPTNELRIWEYWGVYFNISCTNIGIDVPVNILPNSRVTYVTANGVLVIEEFPLVTINCLPPTLQPYITNIVTAPGNAVNMTWTPVIGAELYEIYGGQSQTSIDMTTVIATVPSPQTSWVDTVNPGLYDEYYYLIRAVDTGTIPWTRSVTSNTVGFFKVDFPYGVNGLNTFSIPLRSFTGHTLDWYLNGIPSATSISWLDDNDYWFTYPGTSPPLAELGKGYVLEVSADTSFVFTGEPAAMIRYTDDYGWDFDSSATVTATLTGPDVQLSWPDLGLGIEYYVYWSDSRDGFFRGSYSTLNGGGPVAGTIYTDSGAASMPSENYYMIVPYNTGTGENGSSTYSIGVMTFEYNGNEMFGLPLKPVWGDRSADWYVDRIPYALGIVYLEDGIWKAHFKEFAESVYDTMIELGRGYELTVYMATHYSFIGH